MTLLQAERIEIETAAHRYFAGRMAEAEEEAFELRMLENPEIAQEAEAMQRMRLGLKTLQAQSQIEPLTRAQPVWFSPVSLAAAASVLIIVLASLFYVARITQPVAVLAASGSASATYLVAQRRGMSNEVIIQLTQPPAAVQLDVLPTSESATKQYDVSLSEGNRSLGQITVPAGPQGFVSVFLDTTRLKAGRYVLTLTTPAGSTAYTLVLED